MKKNITAVCEVPELTIGHRSQRSHVPVLCTELGRQNRRRGRAPVGPRQPPQVSGRTAARARGHRNRRAFGLGGSPGRGLGHEAVVANARELRAVTGRSHRSDSRDAQQLARLARVDAELLNPVRLHGAQQQADLCVIRARAALMKVRTMLINLARGLTKITGRRLPSVDADRFAERVRQAVPEALRPALMPVLNIVEQIAQEIVGYDETIQTRQSLCESRDSTPPLRVCVKSRCLAPP